jgi:hypothetical protein
VEIELDPAQPPEVVRVVAGLLAAAGPAPDPWWTAGIEESLDGGSQSAGAQGEATARPRRTLGAERA